MHTMPIRRDWKFKTVQFYRHSKRKHHINVILLNSDTFFILHPILCQVIFIKRPWKDENTLNMIEQYPIDVALKGSPAF